MEAREFDAALERLREGRTLRIVHDLAMTAGELQAHLRSEEGTTQMVNATEAERATMAAHAQIVVGSLQMLSGCIQRDRPKAWR